MGIGVTTEARRGMFMDSNPLNSPSFFRTLLLAMQTRMMHDQNFLPALFLPSIGLRKDMNCDVQQHLSLCRWSLKNNSSSNSS